MKARLLLAMFSIQGVYRDLLYRPRSRLWRSLFLSAWKARSLLSRAVSAMSAFYVNRARC